MVELFMISEMFKKIILEFQNARNEKFRNHPLANYIRRDSKRIYSC